MQKQAATILLAELMGFQTLAETIPAKEITPLMKDFHALIENTIRLHQGRMNRYTGDTFMAVFYMSKTGNSASINAVDAAIELKDLLNSFILEKKLTPDFNLKLGIVTGSVISGDIGTKDKKQETVMGEAVSHAIRICQFAGEGQILVDENTHEVVKDNCEFQILEPIPLKGGDKTLGVFELLGKKRIKLKPEEFSERKITSEMVGRNREMELIEIHLKKLMAGEGSVVNIIGKAGIGKSRLIDEMKIQPLMKKTALLEGRAQSIGRNLSFHPITHIIKSWAGITEEDPPAVYSEKLHQSIIRLAKEQANEIFPFLATMMGMPLEGKHKERVAGIEGEALEKLILKNLRDLITAAAAIRPLIILIEDMHWADTSSITFLESLFKLVKKNQILYINVFRPGHEETGELILRFLNENLAENHITIKIDPLIEKESRKLIGNLLHNSSLPSEVCEMIIRKTEGNPFFIEEVIRSFIDDGIIEIKGNEFFITEKIHQANIPETINEVILSRVDKLDEKTKDLLKTASVIGRNFYFKVLEEAADTIGELDSRLEYLKDVQLIGESKKKEEIEFLFKHALAQQATYESIILNTKKELHLKIARSIEKVFAENLHEHYSSLAYHYGKAENFEKTEEYLIKAGDEAMKTAASAEAINHYKKVIRILNSDDIQNKDQQNILDIEEKLAYAYYAEGLNRNASELFIKVLSTSNLSKVPKNRFLLLFKVFKSLIQLNFKIKLSKGKVGKRANDHDNRLLKMVLYQGEAGVTFSPKDTFFRNLIILNGFSIQTLATSNFGIVCLMTISSMFPWTGRGIKYGRMLNRFTSSVMDSQEDLIWLYSKYTKAMYDYFVDQLSHDNEDDKVFKLGMETGQVWPPTIYHAYRGIGYIELGRSIETKHLIKNLYQIADDMENSFSRTQYYRVQQTFFIKYRLMDKVIDNSEDIIKFISKTDHSTILLLIHCITSIAYSIKGDINKAKQHFHKAEDLSEKLWLKYYISMTLLAKAYIEMKEIEISLNKDNSIKELLLTSKLLVDASKKVNCNKVEAFRIRAIAFNQNNQASKSLKYFKKSIEFANWYGAKLELSRTYFELGKFLSGSKTKYNELNGHSASYYLEKAKSMFEEMGLQWDLEEYQKFVDNND